MSDSAASLLPTPPPGGWSVEQSFRFCQGVARRDTHRFPVATWPMPTSVQRYAACPYAFARHVDDVVDEDGEWGRIYLPHQDLNAFQVSEAVLLGAEPQPATFAGLMRYEYDRITQSTGHSHFRRRGRVQ